MLHTRATIGFKKEMGLFILAGWRRIWWHLVHGSDACWFYFSHLGKHATSWGRIYRFSSLFFFSFFLFFSFWPLVLNGLKRKAVASAVYFTFTTPLVTQFFGTSSSVLWTFLLFLALGEPSLVWSIRHSKVSSSELCPYQFPNEMLELFSYDSRSLTWKTRPAQR